MDEDWGDVWNQQSDCPHCHPVKDGWPKPIDLQQCSLNNPLMMVIPPGGTHISCPVHPSGHHLFTTQVQY